MCALRLLDRGQRRRPVRARGARRTGAAARRCRRARAHPAPAPEPKVEPAPLAVAPAVVEPPRPVIQKLTLSTDVLFDFGKAELKDSGKQRLDQLASEIKGADVDEIIAVGHADRIASEDFNQKLSEARAQAVKDYSPSWARSPT